MLPEPEHRPAGISQKPVGLVVTVAISLDLRRPIPGIRARRRAMLLAPVPVTTVHEHSHLRTGEHQVSAPIQAGERTSIDPIAETQRVSGAADRELGSSVPTSVAHHRRTGCRRRCPRLVRRHARILPRVCRLENGSGQLWWDMRVTTSGSKAFDDLRDALLKTPALRSELEAALDLNVQRVNPTDRANRFGSGAAVEWILAAIAYAAGVLSIPGGHNANGFDLRDLREDARGLWSVKNQTKRGEWRITNGLGGSGGGFKDATIFVSPSLPGITFVDPSVHFDVAAQVVEKSDAVTLPARAVEEHATEHPECVAICSMPKNPGTGQEDPWMDYVENLLSPDRFPRLSRLFVASKPVNSTLTTELQSLIGLRDSGQITAEQFSMLLGRLGA